MEEQEKTKKMSAISVSFSIKHLAGNISIDFNRTSSIQQYQYPKLAYKILN